MEYEKALLNAWSDLEGIEQGKDHWIRLLNDEYTVDTKNRNVLSASCNIPAKDYVSILVLHYLIKKIKGLPQLSEEWISFKQLQGGEGYYPAFRKRVINTIMRKYSRNPEALLMLTERFKARKSDAADISVILQTFEDRVPYLLTLWKGDEEFGPEANVLFDKSIQKILCTEDIVVLSEFVAHNV